jgi:hypothetical protein
VLYFTKILIFNECFIFVSLTAAAAMRRFEALLLLTVTICLSAASAQNNETATAAHEATRDGKGNRGGSQMISGYLVLMKTKFTDGSSMTSLQRTRLSGEQWVSIKKEIFYYSYALLCKS